MTIGRTIRLFLEDGKPDGIVSAEVMNWTGHVIRAHRNDIDRLVDRPEIKQRPGIYFLIGPPKKVLPRLYVGETENMSRRLLTHRASNKNQFWDDTIIITSKDYNLTKAHVRHLECQVRDLAKDAAKTDLLSTKKDGQFAVLSNADRSDMAYFLDQVQMVLLALGIDFLVKDEVGTAISTMATPTTDASVSQAVDAPRFVLMKAKRQFAYATIIEKKFVILKGSKAREDTPGSYNAYRRQRETLKERGIIADDGTGLLFTQDVPLDSPSAASAIVLDRNDNGRKSWVLESEPLKTYGAWDAERHQVPSPIAGEPQDEEEIDDEDELEDEDEDAQEGEDEGVTQDEAGNKE